MYSFWWQTVQDGSVASARSGDFGIWEIVKIYVPLAAKTLISLPEKSVSSLKWIVLTVSMNIDFLFKTQFSSSSELILSIGFPRESFKVDGKVWN